MRKEPGTDFVHRDRRGTDSIHKRPSINRPPLPDAPRREREHAPLKLKMRRISFLVILVLVLGAVFSFQQIFFAKETVEPLQTLTHLPVIRDIRQLVGANDNKLKGEPIDRINVLVLGQGGAGHDGPYLTDTIILASIKPSTGQISLLSIPRDLVVDIPGKGLERINAANAYGEADDGNGAAFASEVISDMLDQPIDYYVRVDFKGFEEIIDELGGVEITVDREFTDYEYPDENHGVQTIHFDAGPQVLNGERALQYVRSRHSDNEGGDFSRARRQHKLLVALKEKAFDTSLILNPSRMVKLYKKFDKNISTNIQPWEISEFVTIGKKADLDSIIFKVLDDSPAGPLYSTTLSNGAYVLAPKISDYSEIQFIAENLFTINNIKNEHAALSIQNGTPEAGLAYNTAEIFRAFEFQVVEVKNAESQNFQKTILYDLTGGTKKQSLKFLESTLQTKAQKTLPLNTESEDMDFLIILGLDQIPSTSSDNKNSSLNTL